MPSPLTPKEGYTFTVTQMVGSRPTGRISCLSDKWDEPVEIALADTSAGMTVAISNALVEAVMLWTKHAETTHGEKVKSA